MRGSGREMSANVLTRGEMNWNACVVLCMLSHTQGLFKSWPSHLA